MSEFTKKVLKGSVPFGIGIFFMVWGLNILKPVKSTTQSNQDEETMNILEEGEDDETI